MYRVLQLCRCQIAVCWAVGAAQHAVWLAACCRLCYKHASLNCIPCIQAEPTGWFAKPLWHQLAGGSSAQVQLCARPWSEVWPRALPQLYHLCWYHGATGASQLHGTWQWSTCMQFCLPPSTSDTIWGQLSSVSSLSNTHLSARLILLLNCPTLTCMLSTQQGAVTAGGPGCSSAQSAYTNCLWQGSNWMQLWQGSFTTKIDIYILNVGDLSDFCG